MSGRVVAQLSVEVRYGAARACAICNLAIQQGLAVLEQGIELENDPLAANPLVGSIPSHMIHPHGRHDLWDALLRGVPPSAKHPA